MSERRRIYCCGCATEAQARLTYGREIYPHRPDLAGLPFWRCDACGNFVGCHHKTADRTRPLGSIATKEVGEARKQIHKLMDPLWRGGVVNRRDLYARLSGAIGRRYHTAEIRTIDEARTVCDIIHEIARQAMSERRANSSGTIRLNSLTAKAADARVSRVSAATNITAAINGDVRALRLHLDDLNTQLRLLPLTSRLRGPLITRIRDVEDTIGQVEGP